MRKYLITNLSTLNGEDLEVEGTVKSPKGDLFIDRTTQLKPGESIEIAVDSSAGERVVLNDIHRDNGKYTPIRRKRQVVTPQLYVEMEPDA